MRLLATVQKVPGGLMVVPLILGATLNTIDQLHLPWITAVLQWLGAGQTDSGNYEFLRIGGFSQELFKDGALVLIALFLFCSGSQMNLRVGGKALKKGLLLVSAKYLTGLAVGLALGFMFDPINGLLGLSTVAIIAAMTNGNGGMYAALTSQYGNRSDTGAVAILSLNDGPFFTLMSLGLLGSQFPMIAFIAVLLPIALGMLLGNLDEDIRAFLKPGEILPVPFFAFALGANMNLAVFFNPQVVGAGLLLGVMTTVLTGGAGILIFRAFRERSVIAPVSEATTAGNAAGTPAAIAAAAAVAASSGMMSAAEAQSYQDLVNVATSQISIATLTTAILGPAAVIIIDRWQRRRGIDGTLEDEPARTADRVDASSGPGA
ncbi:2-keto-3-deoxygluconate permease [Kushneria sp. TE3]|uniref:2-keto-3-deoxygluconate permease n=1 Tax=Kushneria sp. TE3 TaxID=3449832 RepID=UPI003F68972C